MFFVQCSDAAMVMSPASQTSRSLGLSAAAQHGVNGCSSDKSSTRSVPSTAFASQGTNGNGSPTRLCPPVAALDAAPCVRLVPFATPVTVTYGDVRAGQRVMRWIRVQNPSKSDTQFISLKSIPKDKGFEVTPNDLQVPPKSEGYLCVAWTPPSVPDKGKATKASHHFRGSLLLRWKGRGHVQVKLFGFRLANASPVRPCPFVTLCLTHPLRIFCTDYPPLLVISCPLTV